MITKDNSAEQLIKSSNNPYNLIFLTQQDINELRKYGLEQKVNNLITLLYIMVKLWYMDMYLVDLLEYNNLLKIAKKLHYFYNAEHFNLKPYTPEKINSYTPYLLKQEVIGIEEVEGEVVVIEYDDGEVCGVRVVGQVSDTGCTPNSHHNIQDIVTTLIPKRVEQFVGKGLVEVYGRLTIKNNIVLPNTDYNYNKGFRALAYILLANPQVQRKYAKYLKFVGYYINGIDNQIALSTIDKHLETLKILGFDIPQWVKVPPLIAEESTDDSAQASVSKQDLEKEIQKRFKWIQEVTHDTYYKIIYTQNINTIQGEDVTSLNDLGFIQYRLNKYTINQKIRARIIGIKQMVSSRELIFQVDVAPIDTAPRPLNIKIYSLFEFKAKGVQVGDIVEVERKESGRYIIC